MNTLFSRLIYRTRVPSTFCQMINHRCNKQWVQHHIRISGRTIYRVRELPNINDYMMKVLIQATKLFLISMVCRRSRAFLPFLFQFKFALVLLTIFSSSVSRLLQTQPSEDIGALIMHIMQPRNKNNKLLSLRISLDPTSQT